ncbi:MAG TPA: PepSY domain-containing protein [Cellvibrio sp.]|nr:PepSY domain-containing protein [Cellvibrio sp.]
MNPLTKMRNFYIACCGAGIFAIPFVLILSLTGAIYLFKPQIDAFNDAPYRHLSITGELASADQQVAAAIASLPSGRFSSYELPREPFQAVHILVNQGSEKYRVTVHPQTLEILNIRNEQRQLLRIVHDIHGELLLGKVGAVLVELAACWAIVLVLTGLYLWWPRNSKGLAGVLYPRLAGPSRIFWRDLHSVIGFWISLLVLFLLVSGLPWALVWGSALKEVRQLGSAPKVQDWNIAGQHHHEVAAETKPAAQAQSTSTMAKVSLELIVKNAQQLHLAHPVLISPPSSKASFWMKTSAVNWSVNSTAQNRTLRADVEMDPYTGAVVSKQEFSGRDKLDQVIGIGIAAHEGQLFGWLNQLLGLLTALGLILMSIAGFILWRKRAPANCLGAPPAPTNAKIGFGFAMIILLSAILLPALGLSLLVIAAVEFIFLSRWSRARIWLGL